jgi:DNA-binding LytR/AlgR family response regulator
MFRSIIIDDDYYAILTLEKYIDLFPGIEFVATYNDPLIALKSINNDNLIDLIFVNIDMQKTNDIKFLMELKLKTAKLIFTTENHKSGYYASKKYADDYLVKPFNIGEFMISMNRIVQVQTNLLKKDFFFVKSKDDNLKKMNIKFKDIIAVESKLNYVLIHTTSKDVLTYISLKEISKLFEGRTDFVQFNRSFIISYQYIEFIDGNCIKMYNGIQFTVGDYYRKSYTDFINNYLITASRNK